MDFQFKRNRVDKISRSKIIEELERVAKHFDYKDFRGKEFDNLSDISFGTVIREFGTWEKALSFLKENLSKKNIELGSRRNKRQYKEKELFDEMERIWNLLGHRPSVNEWNLSKASISDNTYMRYFGGWQNACLKFIEHKMGGSIFSDEEEKEISDKEVKATDYKPEYSRNIPLNIRLKVLDRDNFRCVFCGRSPATDIGIKLHIDHIEPFSKGGKSIFENLQTLCQDCNLGKSNRVVINMVE